MKTKNEKIINEISKISFDILKEHSEWAENKIFYIDKNYRDFGIDRINQGDKKIHLDKCLTEIKKIVKHLLEIQKIIILYTCPDNSQICFEDYNKENLKHCELQKLNSTNENIFYIAFD